MDALWYGGDYNPEQWPREVWGDDIRLMTRAGVTVATVGVFSWAHLEPEDGLFEFAWLDDIIDRLHTAGIRIDLATATASPPPWLSTAHPDILPVTAEGVTLGIGSRQHYSPSSSTYRRYADRLVRELAQRYGTHPALEAWHVNNELACHVRHDFSDESAVAFRGWLTARYGTIDRLNEAWGTSFWAQRYNDFEQILPPRAMPTFGNPTQLLDFDRFSSDAWLGVFRAEAAILRELSPGIPITTNYMSFFIGGDYWAWSEELDFISSDHYIDPADPDYPVRAAMSRDLMRSLAGGQPWILMEQAPSAVNWRERNAPIPRGVHRAMSLQAIARGADGIMQFQWRQSIAGSEKFHSAMVPHAGEDTRIFRQTEALGAELSALGPIVGSRLSARVAILFDWQSWWVHQQRAMPATIDYIDGVGRWYRELWKMQVLVDFVRPGAELSGYELVIVPAAVSLDDDARSVLDRFARAGGQLVVGYMTAILDENLHVTTGGYLGQLQQTLGVRVDEFAPPAAPSLSGGEVPGLAVDGLGAGAARDWGEVVTPLGAQVLSTFVGGLLDGMPAITRNEVGDGRAWYVATAPDDLESVVRAILPATTLSDPPPQAVGVEIVERGPYRFTLNHSASTVATETGPLEGYGARIEALTPR